MSPRCASRRWFDITITLVLLPGLDGTGLLFQPLVDALPEEIRARVVDYPCKQPLTYDQLLARILDALPRNGPYVVLGESFSGPLALRVAAQEPPGLKAIILCATFIRNPLPYFPCAAGRWLRPWLFYAAPLLVRLKTLLPSRSKLRPLLISANSMVAPAVWCTRVRELLAVDALPELRSCKVPLLYLQGLEDCVVPSCNLRFIQEHKADVCVARIKAPHLLLQTRPEEAAKAISAFLKELKAL